MDRIQPVSKVYNITDRKKPKKEVKEMNKRPFKPPDNIA